ncbi:MAG: stage II sporulation protein P [Clostridiales bacterium]|nr:stage II sporulation protein P [Clostridiales bacterium]
MMRVTRQRLRRERRRRQTVILLWGAMAVFVCMLFSLAVKNGNMTRNVSCAVCSLMLRQISPNLAENLPSEYYEDSEENYYETRTESTLSYETVLAQDAEDVSDAESGEDDGAADSTEENSTPTEEETSTEEASAGTQAVSLEKLNDFDYLIQNFYTVDSATTITSAQLNAEELLSVDCTLTGSSDAPQILIYHTHASEGYSDSVEGDPSTTVVAVGERLAEILETTYGYNVLHDTGVYDSDRNRAYSVAKPYIEQILAENPSIEVVIDLHRDGVSEDTRLVTEQNGVQMAQVMFFNGLSRTSALGDIDYLANPYITQNLAFSLRLQLAARELYPGFTRKIYLKGYRYNMHLMPKSLLVEVGAQTNTLEEAKNAMEPLAAILDQVLGGAE